VSLQRIILIVTEISCSNPLTKTIIEIGGVVLENQVMEYEKQQGEVTNKSRTVFSKLEGSYKESENLINSIKKKQLELAAIRKKLWITITIMAILIIAAVALKTYI